MNTVRQRGFSLIELMVALAIGSFLIIGAVTMQANTRKTFTVNESQARLQETARYVISVLEPELQLAGNYGFTNRPEDLRYSGINTPVQNMRTWSTQVGGLPAVLEQCGKHYGVDVISTVSATNNGYGLAAGCAAQGGGHNGTSDTLTIRHAGVVPITVLDGSKYQIQTTRLSQFENRMFIGSAAPTTSAVGDREVRDMFVATYYVSVNSDNRPGIPALRMKFIGTTGTVPVIVDQEVIRGVEDLQVEFGVDPGIDMDGDGVGEIVNGYTARYVAPNNAIAQTGQIVAARIWVRVRAEEAEQGFRDTRTYSYAGVTFTANDNFRRVLMSRTVFLRGARGMAF
jgi:type IV pilus assembly protein PilW